MLRVPGCPGFRGCSGVCPGSQGCLGVPEMYLGVPSCPGGPEISWGMHPKCYRMLPGGPGVPVEVWGGSRRVPDPHLTPLSPQRCLHRIRQALQHYRDLLGSDIFRDQPQPQLETTMEQLLRHVQEGHGHHPRVPIKVWDFWAQPYQRHQALKRLRSFAAVMGRVFNHSAR
uniref:Interleukin-23 subunit alpha n=1 Tax=Catharus ustulatus TaxID=91951 RepID=A0A8C3UEQ4_CATUS